MRRFKKRQKERMLQNTESVAKFFLFQVNSAKPPVKLIFHCKLDNQHFATNRTVNILLSTI